MKVRNIMFSGVMASILMMGGAYAVEPTAPIAKDAVISNSSVVASKSYVQGGVQAASTYAKEYTDWKVGDIGNTDVATYVTNQISTAVTDPNGAVRKAVTDDIKDLISVKEANMSGQLGYDVSNNPANPAAANSLINKVNVLGTGDTDISLVGAINKNTAGINTNAAAIEKITTGSEKTISIKSINDGLVKPGDDNIKVVRNSDGAFEVSLANGIVTEWGK